MIFSLLYLPVHLYRNLGTRWDTDGRKYGTRCSTRSLWCLGRAETALCCPLFDNRVRVETCGRMFHEAEFGSGVRIEQRLHRDAVCEDKHNSQHSEVHQFFALQNMHKNICELRSSNQSIFIHDRCIRGPLKLSVVTLITGCSTMFLSAYCVICSSVYQCVFHSALCVQ